MEAADLVPFLDADRVSAPRFLTSSGMRSYRAEARVYGKTLQMIWSKKAGCLPEETIIRETGAYSVPWSPCIRKANNFLMHLLKPDNTR
ncbi:hypothetical protein OPV22_029551 [Ensete ventricosum]|uniref:Uncharacterized protein n=1 Tax=Ensete ventricosum TaxID=4639 RepID=A0AAV8Q749_ENSVE|nr:hypothetical protein OPV22_029551 [Ensete ventricosum]